jgi:tRNA uracil 4-sulfurtransferase
MEKVIIHHGEIFLKRGNYGYFEKKLMRNIKKACKEQGLKLEKITTFDKRILCVFGDKKEKIIPVLEKVFGIKYFVFIDEIERDIKSMKKYVEKFLKKSKPKTIAFKIKRADKLFEFKSTQIKEKFGEIANGLGIKVNYSASEKTISCEITSKKVYFYEEKIKGPGGLPVGTSGKVLCLFSGGIDSAVASWLMMKRGCTVDYLHFHVFPDNKKVENTKIKRILSELDKYEFGSKLYLLPYAIYEVETMGTVLQKYDLVLFKHYILKVAEKFALENHYDAIVTGDNLAQVASQTMENIKATSLGISLPLFRPLLTYDKQEIIDLAKKINTYEPSIEKYKDCCSILSKKPSTKTKLTYFAKLVDNINLDKLVDKSLKEISEI